MTISFQLYIDTTMGYRLHLSSTKCTSQFTIQRLLIQYYERKYNILSNCILTIANIVQILIAIEKDAFTFSSNYAAKFYNLQLSCFAFRSCCKDMLKFCCFCDSCFCNARGNACLQWKVLDQGIVQSRHTFCKRK